MGLGAWIARLVRSGVAGAGASLADLAVLAALTELAGLSPRAASVPALLVGAVAMYFGQKYLAFQSRAAPSRREVLLFAAVQAGGLALTALCFELALRALPGLTPYYVLVRLVTTNLVWLFYSFPLWHFVFRAPAAASAKLTP